MNKAMLRLTVFLIISIVCGACQRKVDPGAAAATEVRKVSNLTATDELPLLERHLMRPIKDEGKFIVETHEEIRFRSAENSRRPPNAPQPKTDEETIREARQWIEDYFGKFPEEISLQVEEVSHAADYPAEFKPDWIGPIIKFRQCYRGIPTQGWTSVDLATPGNYSIRVILYAYTIVPNSAKKIVTADEATKAWRVLFEQNKPEKLADFDKHAHARLMYEWSPQANRGSPTINFDAPATTPRAPRRDIEAPCWALDAHGLFMIDGHSGKAWHND